MKVKNHVSNEERNVMSDSEVIVADLKPDPKESYTVTYERIVLDDNFSLSKLKDDVILDVWLTHPKMNTITSNTTSNTTIEIDGTFELRDLNSNIFVYTSNISNENKPEAFFATVAEMGINSSSPQDEFMFDQTYDSTPKLLQHTNFSIVQKEIKINTPPFLGTTLTVMVNPKECGDLMSNMYFKCTLPPNINYIDRVGRALFNKVEMYFNEQLIEYYDDDWSIVHDELFMTADEQLALDEVLKEPELLIPLKFFFCTKKEYLPLCAMNNQFIYFKFYFNTQSWFTDYTDTIDITNVSIIFDQIFITNEERNYYKTNKTEIIVPIIYRETPQEFSQGFVNMNMSANFNVSMINWFIKNVNSDYTSRYSYGYVSKLVKSYTNFTNWRGEIINYVPVIDYINIFINNKNIVNGLTGDIYYTYKQPLEHGLSIPDKIIYTYCFSQLPITKSNGIDFGTLASKTTNLQIKFSDSIISQLVKNYRLYLYYYGYTKIVFDNGFAVVDSL